jgi:Cft2 family RNA processing exonuclease
VSYCRRLPPVAEREKRFTELVRDIVEVRRGKALLPVFALGRAQELLLILDEYWAANPALHHIPIYYASALAKKTMSCYSTYLNMMNRHIQAAAQIRNPFHFKFVFNLKANVESVEDVGPCVVMASPGMLQNGLSRELLEMWAADAENGLVMTGYAVEVSHIPVEQFAALRSCIEQALTSYDLLCCCNCVLWYGRERWRSTSCLSPSRFRVCRVEARSL